MGLKRNGSPETALLWAALANVVRNGDKAAFALNVDCMSGNVDHIFTRNAKIIDAWFNSKRDDPQLHERWLAQVMLERLLAA